MAAAKASKLRAHASREYPNIVRHLHSWRRCRTPDGRPAVEARVDRSAWPAGPARVRFFHHHGDLGVQIWRGGESWATVRRASDDTRFVVHPFPAADPNLN